jgi:hypothetical protein
MKKPIVLCMLSFTAFTVMRCYGGEDACADVHIPAPIRSAIEGRFPSWQIVKVRDLRSDDQKLWLQAHKEECPGIAIGHFEGAAITSHAVTLFRSAPTLQQILLVVSPNPAGKPRVHILSKPQHVAFLSVVYKTPSGNYSEVEGGATINVRNEAVVHEGIEAGSVLFYFLNGKYRSLITSE